MVEPSYSLKHDEPLTDLEMTAFYSLMCNNKVEEYLRNQGYNRTSRTLGNAAVEMYDDGSIRHDAQQDAESFELSLEEKEWIKSKEDGRRAKEERFREVNGIMEPMEDRLVSIDDLNADEAGDYHVW